MEEAKKMKCYKRLMYKQFVQVSGLSLIHSWIQHGFPALAAWKEVWDEMAVERSDWALKLAYTKPLNLFEGFLPCLLP